MHCCASSAAREETLIPWTSDPSGRRQSQQKSEFQRTTDLPSSRQHSSDRRASRSMAAKVSAKSSGSRAGSHPAVMRFSQFQICGRAESRSITSIAGLVLTKRASGVSSGIFVHQQTQNEILSKEQ